MISVTSFSFSSSGMKFLIIIVILSPLSLRNPIFFSIGFNGNSLYSPAWTLKERINPFPFGGSGLSSSFCRSMLLFLAACIEKGVPLCKERRKFMPSLSGRGTRSPLYSC